MELAPTRKKEILGILWLGIALLLFLSLFSYSPLDPSFNNSQVAAGVKVYNYIGPFGSYLADILYQILGWGAYLLPFLLLLEAVHGLSFHLDERPKIRLWGLSFLFVSVLIVCALTITPQPMDTYKPGGIIGDLLTNSMLGIFQISGTVIITALLFCLGLLMATEFLFSSFFGKLRAGLTKILAFARKREVAPEEVIVKPVRKITPTYLEEELAPNTPAPKTATNELPLFKNLEVARAENDNGQYRLPPLNLLKLPPKVENSKQYEAEIQATARKLEEVLLQFGVKAEVVGYARGPVITRYELEPADGVKVNRIVSLADDLALRLEAKTIRIIAPIPGKAAVGIELPNEVTQPVTLGELLTHSSYKQGPDKLLLGLGKTISGEIFWADLEKMPHLLVAGATGAGKSVCINTIIANILYNATPEEVKFVLIDPKRVELNIFEDLPHLLVPVVVEVEEASQALKWAVREMEFRYQNFARLGTRNIQGYNQAEVKRKEELELAAHLPYIVVIIDEFADLMMLAGKEVEAAVTRLAQMARAVGIHLILATQRPSVDVITGLIKANFPARIAFKVASKIDSRTILDGNGAEKLLGEGDMLFSPSGATKPTRLQGPYISREELIEVTSFIRLQQAPHYVMEILQPELDNDEETTGGAGDELYDAAVRIVIEEQVASSSRLQRRLKIGYNRAARLIEEMEERGIVGPLQNNNTRAVNKGREFLLRESN